MRLLAFPLLVPNMLAHSLALSPLVQGAAQTLATGAARLLSPFSLGSAAESETPAGPPPTRVEQALQALHATLRNRLGGQLPDKFTFCVDEFGVANTNALDPQALALEGLLNSDDQLRDQLRELAHRLAEEGNYTPGAEFEVELSANEARIVA